MISLSQACPVALQRCFDLPARLFPKPVPSTIRSGPLHPELANQIELKAGQMEVTTTCSHDTAAAVAAVPTLAAATNWAYLVSGTRSLLGVECAEPQPTPEARAAGFSSEPGGDGSVRLFKDLAGLGLLQEARREWARHGQVFTVPQLLRQARAASPFGSLFLPDAARFARPDDLPGEIAAYCRETGQRAPGSPGEFVRCILESLALSYRRTLGQVERLTRQRARVLHIVGSGCQNALLNQWTANATGRQILAGPTEATAIGTVLLQAMASGEVESISHLRGIVAYSFPVRVFPPRERTRWDTAAERFTSLEPGE